MDKYSAKTHVELPESRSRRGMARSLGSVIKRAEKTWDREPGALEPGLSVGPRCVVGHKPTFGAWRLGNLGSGAVGAFGDAEE